LKDIVDMKRIRVNSKYQFKFVKTNGYTCCMTFQKPQRKTNHQASGNFQ
jgi:hypothetical protein